MALALALDSGFRLRLKPGAPMQCTHNCENNRGAKLARAQSRAEVVVSKRIYFSGAGVGDGAILFGKS